MTERRKPAARIVGLLLSVFVRWAVQDLDAEKKPPVHPINLNTASSAELQEVPGIGPAAANKILQARKSYGAFKSVDDLEAIKGIAPRKLEKMRKYLTVGKPAQTPKTATNAAPSTPTKSPPPTKSATKSAPASKSAPPPLSPRPTSSEDEEQ